MLRVFLLEKVGASWEFEQAIAGELEPPFPQPELPPALGLGARLGFVQGPKVPRETRLPPFQGPDLEERTERNSEPCLKLLQTRLSCLNPWQAFWPSHSIIIPSRFAKVWVTTLPLQHCKLSAFETEVKPGSCITPKMVSGRGTLGEGMISECHIEWNQR